MAEVQRLEQRIVEQQSSVPQAVRVTREDFTELAGDIEAIWNREGSSERLKKRILRTLIHEIVVDLDEAAGEVNLVIHWQGGMHTELMVPRRRRGSATKTSSDVIEAVR